MEICSRLVDLVAKFTHNDLHKNVRGIILNLKSQKYFQLVAPPLDLSIASLGCPLQPRSF